MNREIAEREYEQACIDLMNATDANGLKVRLGPAPRFSDNPLKGAMPIPRDYGIAARNLLCTLDENAHFFDGTEMKGELALARNIGLLVNVWIKGLIYNESLN